MLGYYYEDKTLQIKEKKEQLKLLEFFALEVTTRPTADTLGIQPNTSAPFYHKIREVTSHHLALQAEEVLAEVPPVK